MRVLFLDIDGVLKPPTNPGCCGQSADELAAIHAEAFKRVGFDYQAEVIQASDEYQARTIRDIIRRSAEFIRPKIVRDIKSVLDETGSMIVVSSNWREGGYRLVRALLAMHGLGDYVVGMTSFGLTALMRPETQKRDFEMWNEAQTALRVVCEKMRERRGNRIFFYERLPEIMDYLHRHDEISGYAVLDDEDHLDDPFGEHGIHTKYMFEHDQVGAVKKALSIECPVHRFDLIEETTEIAAWHRKWDTYYVERMGMESILPSRRSSSNSDR